MRSPKVCSFLHRPSPKTYLDGGPAVFRPAIVSLSDSPVPGVCEGLKEVNAVRLGPKPPLSRFAADRTLLGCQGLIGARVGTVRAIDVPPALGFGSRPVVGPFAVVPANSTLTYEVQDAVPPRLASPLPRRHRNCEGSTAPS